MMRVRTIALWLLLVLGSAFMLIQLTVFGLLLWWRSHPVEQSAFMLQYRLRAAFDQKLPALRHQWVEGHQISDALRRALVVAEDARFVQHRGFDWKGIAEARARNAKKGTVVAGGSTISQQLSKNLFLWNQRSYVRKAEEALITVMLERLWRKDRILTVYLNSIEFGQGIYGAEAAAQHYFGKSASRLSAQEAASLAARVPNPVYFQAHPQDRALRNRTRIIRRYMPQAQLPPRATAQG